MAMDFKVPFSVFAAFVLVLEIFALAVRGKGDNLAPASALTSDGTEIDQAVAYGLMVLALVITYLIHTFDASPFNL